MDLVPGERPPIFKREIGKATTGYLCHRISLSLSKHTIEKGEQHLYRFLCYLNTAKVIQ